MKLTKSFEVVDKTDEVSSKHRFEVEDRVLRL
ncbi:chlorohydrolase [Streptococcus pneumoniae]|nr:chlorohydrolase [Streptococcus pneumoniae]